MTTRNGIARISGHKLQQRRERLFRESPLCRNLIGHRDQRVWTQLDHVVPLTRGGADDESNLQGLCDECHAHKTRIDLGFKAKPVIGDDGWPKKIDGATSRGGVVKKQTRGLESAREHEISSRPFASRGGR